jgi:hypothetical protein
VSYAARAAGVTRHMRVHDALRACPGLRLVHVQTIGGEGASDGAEGSGAAAKRDTTKARRRGALGWRGAVGLGQGMTSSPMQRGAASLPAGSILPAASPATCTQAVNFCGARPGATIRRAASSPPPPPPPKGLPAALPARQR